jgi:uncharacterized membrane protein YGL010W
MKTSQEWFDAYGVSHQNPTNKAIHWVCVPVILFTTIGLFWSIPAGPLAPLAEMGLGVYANWATVLVAVALVFYASLRWTIFLGMLATSVFCLWGNQAIEAGTETPLWLTSVVAFVIAWAGQFIGHKIEGLKPSFFEDIQYLLVGPAWLLHFIYKKVGIPY